MREKEKLFIVKIIQNELFLQQLIFESSVGNSTEGLIALDDFELLFTPCQDSDTSNLQHYSKWQPINKSYSIKASRTRIVDRKQNFHRQYAYKAMYGLLLLQICSNENKEHKKNKLIFFDTFRWRSRHKQQRRNDSSSNGSKIKKRS